MRERIFNADNKFFGFMGKVSDLIILNILFVVCSLPVVTIGASLTAMNYVTLKMIKNEESYISRSFFKSFKQNFKQATPIWLVLLAVAVLLFFDFNIIAQAGNQGFFQYISIGLYFILLLWGMIFVYVFPLLARFENTVKNTCKNALKMAVCHFPWTVLLLAITCVPMFFTLNYGAVLMIGLFVWPAIGFALTSFFNAKILTRIFARYIPEEEEEREWTMETPEEP